MENSNSNTLNCKVVMLGESAVGKTSIINRYINNAFNPDSMSTSGASYASKTMYFDSFNKNIKFDIWDTAGQERFRTITSSYYKGAQAVIFVFDITEKKSFESVESFHKGVLEVNEPKYKILVGNKAELSDTRQVSK